MIQQTARCPILAPLSGHRKRRNTALIARLVLIATLLFGLWHLPGLLTQGLDVASAAFSILPIALLSLVSFNGAYEWTGLLPLVALFHGWNDDKLLPLLGTPTLPGALLGYALMLALIVALGRRREQQQEARPSPAGTFGR